MSPSCLRACDNSAVGHQNELGNIELTDGDLTLLPWGRIHEVPNLADDVLATVTDEAMIRFTHVPHPYTEMHLKSFLNVPDRDIARWALILGERYAGSLELRTQQQDAASIGYSAAPWARGRGLVTRAVKVVTQSAHSAGIRDVQIRVAVDNTSSRSVAERAGFVLNRIEAEGEEIRGKFNDVAEYLHSVEQERF